MQLRGGLQPELKSPSWNWKIEKPLKPFHNPVYIYIYFRYPVYIYIYFEVLDCHQNGKIESLLIENSIFTDILPDQSNIVLVEFGYKSHNLTFSRALKRHDLTGLN